MASDTVHGLPGRPAPDERLGGPADGARRRAGTQAAQACPACRVGDSLDLTLFGGVDPSGHLLLADPSTTEALALYQTASWSGQSPSGFASLPLSRHRVVPAGVRHHPDRCLVADLDPHAHGVDVHLDAPGR